MYQQFQAKFVEPYEPGVNYYDKVAGWLLDNGFNDDEIKNFFVIYDGLREKKSDYWFYTALTLKPPCNWQAYGWGLFRTNSFIEWVDKKVGTSELEANLSKESTKDLIERYRR